MRTLVGLLLALVLAVPAAAQTGRVSAGNSTTAVLGSGATFTGAWDDATQAAVVVVTIKADQASATNGVKVEFSSDCVNQDYVTTHSFTDTVNGQTFADAMAAKCVRIEFVNGASGQASFRLQTVVRDNGYGGTSSGGTASSVTIADGTTSSQKLAVNASGQASVTCANCSGSGASAVDRATFTLGTNSIAPSGGIFDDTPPTDLTAGMAGIVRMTPKRAFHVQLRNQAGTEVGTSTTPLQVTGANGTFPVTGTFFQATQPVSLAAAVDVSDRAGRLVGVVYGSQAQQLKQTATNFNLQSELAVGGTLIDPRDVSDRSGRALGSIANLFVLDATLTGRLPAGASPASAETNTNTNLSRIGTYPFVFNGTTWDRWTGAVSGTVTANAGTGNFTVAQATGTNLHMVCDSGCSSSAGFADNAAFTFGTTAVNPIAGVLDDVASNTATENSAAVVRITQNKGLHINLRNAAGTEVGTSTTPLQVTGANGTFPVTGTFFQATQPVSIADGSDTTLGAKADAKSTATDTTAVSIMSVLKEISALEQAPASRAVTNAGTFADQATLQTQTDTVMVGGVNVKEINGVAPLMGAGATGTGAQRVNDVASSATGAAVPASATYVGGLGSGSTGGNLAGATACDSDANINISTATTTLLITGVSGRKVHICFINVGPVPSAQTFVLIEGTGATCGTGTAAFWGGTTAASGWSFAANGGLGLGTGFGDIKVTTTTGDSVCAVTGSAVATAGTVKYAIY